MKIRSMFQIRSKISKTQYITIAIISFGLFIFLWNFMSVSGIIDSKFLPTPLAVAKEMVNMIIDGTFWDNFKISFYRIMMGVVYSIIIAVPVGLVCGCFSPIEAFVRPLYEFIRYMPVPSIVPLVMIFAGIDEQSKIAVVFIGTFFQMALMVADDTASIPNDLISASYTLGTSKFRTICTVVLPMMLPQLLKTLRMMVGWAWTYLVVAELVGANSGLGYLILRAQRFFHTETMYAGIIFIGLIGLVIDRLFAIAIKVLFPWQEEGE